MMKSEERKENFKKEYYKRVFSLLFFGFWWSKHLTAKFFADSFFLRKMTMRENFEFCVFCPL